LHQRLPIYTIRTHPDDTRDDNLDNHMAAIALHFMHYNFARPHKTLSTPCPRTPAMAAGVTDHIYSLRDIASWLE
jgi:hypothetical protein